MSKYKDNFDKLANSIYSKIMEAVQPDPTQQAQQQMAAPQQQIDPTAMAAADQAAGAAGQAVDQSAGTVGMEDPMAAGAAVDASAGVEDPSLQTGEEGQGMGEADEVGMSEIQEMSGQLAQMLRDFKETNPDEFVEAAKFAAGMVVSAAISGLKYRDRKDILKKVKAGEFNQDGEEGGVEDSSVEQQPEGQEGIVAERLRKDDSRKEGDTRKGLNPKEKKNIKSKKSPFSGVNEAQYDYDYNKSSIGDIDNAANGAWNAGENTLQVNAVGGQYSGVALDAKTSSEADSNARNGYSSRINKVAEAVKLTKRQLDMIRLSETKTKFVKFSKKQIDEIMKK